MTGNDAGVICWRRVPTTTLKLRQTRLIAGDRDHVIGSPLPRRQSTAVVGRLYGSRQQLRSAAEVAYNSHVPAIN